MVGQPRRWGHRDGRANQDSRANQDDGANQDGRTGMGVYEVGSV